MKNKKLIYLIFYATVCGAALLGVLLGMLMVMISEKHPDYLTINLGQGILLVLFSIWLTSLLHELAHAIAFKYKRIDIRMFYVFPLCFIKEDKKVRIYVTANLIIGFGGIVIPSLGAAKSLEELKQVKKDLRASLACAPICSALWGISCLLYAIFVTDRITIEYRSWFFVFCIANFLMALYVNISSLFSFGGIVGDYAACRKINTENDYALLQLYTYYVIQSNEKKKHFRKETFFYRLIALHISECIDKKKISMKVLALLDAVLYEALLRDTTEKESLLEFLKQVTIYLKGFEENYKAFGVFYRCYSHLVMCLYINGERDMAMELWNSNQIPITKAGNYYSSQINMMLTGEKEPDLFNKKKLMISSTDTILFHMENYFDDELQLNKLLLREKTKF